MRIEVDLYDDNLKKAILALPFNFKLDDDGTNCDMIFIPESDYGFAKIFRVYDEILVFLIPQYGGLPYFGKSFKRHSIENLISYLREMRDY